MLIVGLLGFSAVGLGAFGAHALRNRITSDQQRSWNTAVQYQLVHTLAALAATLATKDASSGTLGRTCASRLRLASKLWIVGTVLFSGSIYVLVLNPELKAFGPVTPVGGVVLMLGWVAVALSAL